MQREPATHNVGGSPSRSDCLTSLLYHKALWSVLSALLFLSVFLQLFESDNHKFLMSYWVFAVALALHTDAGSLLAWNGRWLIGLCFTFAVGWKALSPDFLTGEFMEYTLLVDSRFASFTQLVASVPDEVMAANRLARHQVVDLTVTSAPMTVPAGVTRLAVVLTATTMALETAIAASFLLARRVRWLRRLRNWLLIAFCLSTYAIATVTGFAWTVCILGLAQSRRSERAARLAYIGTICAISVFSIDWGGLVRGIAVVFRGDL